MKKTGEEKTKNIEKKQNKKSRENQLHFLEFGRTPTT